MRLLALLKLVDVITGCAVINRLHTARQITNAKLFKTKKHQTETKRYYAWFPLKT